MPVKGIHNKFNPVLICTDQYIYLGLVTNLAYEDYIFLTNLVYGDYVQAMSSLPPYCQTQRQRTQAVPVEQV